MWKREPVKELSENRARSHDFDWVNHILPLVYDFLFRRRRNSCVRTIFNAIFAALGFGLWFTCKYISIERINLLRTLENHLVSAAFTAAIWLAVCIPL